MSTGAILLIAATLNLALIIGLSLTTALLKARRERRARRHEQELALLRPVMMRYLATWEDGDAHDLADMLIGYHGVTTSFEELVAGLLPKLRGADRSMLVDILRRRGTIDQARQGTGSRWAVRRYRAVELLGAAGVSEGIPDAAALLGDRNTDVRLAAVRALGRIGTVEAAAALLEHLDSDEGRKHPIPPHPVTMALLRIGTDATDPLTRALEAGQVEVRTIATEVLGVLGVYPAVAGLQARMRLDPSASVRLGATHALGRLSMPSSAGDLTAMLRTEEDVEVLAAACAALGRIIDPSTIPDLEHAVAHPHPTVRVAAAMALVPFGATGLDRLREIAQRDAEGGDAAREVLARNSIATDTTPLISL
ncbi:HEAT repeat domain-containing protein [Kineosporia sp. J2-2]|uniref:HEAT repeat domain-containing protein n=1 Tax=Kineosporia corallincola TaxID=2835133 RepID=A0ABS5TPP8_9ACTN|nr:HEAT repeat domain-containing protein [Kineosporia corallincola]MBT0773077.1 HEAT repeat domain-containing protein [Kineosporia corallincola]